ncbi:ABC transporter ATP-binding protein [Isosphaeraceae bacterium EP7]
MIRVDRLCKRYGGVAAVEDLSFHVGRGEVVGLLGPNGAGKTTTMRMLTTFLPPTSGRAALAGHDVLDEPLEVRRRIGYLPENVPLYGEMRVRDYLVFRAKLKDVRWRQRRRAVDSAIERCKLDEVRDRIIGQLSRGFRQRVGLADALLHEPDVLILDEPTAGLDPLQVREVRTLIRELGQSHTVLLSTHILPEVEATCGRVIIIARGRIALDASTEAGAGEQGVVVEARGPAGPMLDAVGGVAGVAQVVVASRDGEHLTLDVRSEPGADPREAIGLALAGRGWPIRRLDLRRTTLEERFVQAVGAASLVANLGETEPSEAA